MRTPFDEDESPQQHAAFTALMALEPLDRGVLLAKLLAVFLAADVKPTGRRPLAMSILETALSAAAEMTSRAKPDRETPKPGQGRRQGLH